MHERELVSLYLNWDTKQQMSTPEREFSAKKDAAECRGQVVSKPDTETPH